MQGPARLIVWALAFQGVAVLTGCDRPPAANRPATTPASQPASAPTSGPASDEFGAKLAVLEHLAAGQPRGADRSEYAAYLIKDHAAEELALALSSSAAAGGGPPVVGTLDVYTRKGRTMDRASGRPVKVFRARVVRSNAQERTAEVLASWQGSRLLAETYRYSLRHEAGRWVVARRAREGT